MNSAKFDGGAKKARGSLRSLAEGAVAVNAAMGVIGAVINAVGRGIGEFAEQSSKIDDLGKLSERLGISTENLGALHHAAKLANIETASLDSSIEKMTINLAKAKQGGEVAKVFNSMGLSAEKLIAQDPMAALGQIADGLNRIPNAAERSAATVAIFGKSGAAMGTLLKDGSKGLADMRQEADALGITFSSFDAAAVERANDAMERLKTIIDASFQWVMINLAPWFEAGASAIGYFVEEVKQGNVIFGFFDAFEHAADHFNNLDVGLSAITEAERGLTAQTKAANTALERQKQIASQLTKFYEALSDREEDRFDVINAGLTPLEQYDAKQRGLSDMLKMLEHDYRRVADPIDTRSYDYQKEHLEREIENNRVAEEKRKKDDYADSFVGQIASAMKSPAQKLAEAIAEIDKKTDPIFGGEGSDFLSTEQAKFAKLQARKSYLESLPDDEESQTFRQSALVRGSAEAFSASFGNKPQEKKLSEIADTNRQILELMRAQDKPVVVTLP